MQLQDGGTGGMRSQRAMCPAGTNWIADGQGQRQPEKQDRSTKDTRLGGSRWSHPRRGRLVANGSETHAVGPNDITNTHAIPQGISRSRLARTTDTR